jgi:hypothetical protein
MDVDVVAAGEDSGSNASKACETANSLAFNPMISQ